MNLEREDIKLIPRALLGLTLAAYNMYLKPIYQEKKKLAKAAMYFYDGETKEVEKL